MESSRDKKCDRDPTEIPSPHFLQSFILHKNLFPQPADGHFQPKKDRGRVAVEAAAAASAASARDRLIVTGGGGGVTAFCY